MTTSDASATTYARALFAAAGDTAGVVAGELRALVDLRDESPEAWAELVAPQVPAEALKSTLDQLFASAQSITRNFLRVLVDNRRLDALADIYASFEQMVREHEQQLDVRITTAVELTPDLRTVLEERLSSSTGKQVRLHASVDPAIVGGLVVQHGDTLVDASIRTRLEQLRRELSRPGSSITARRSDHSTD